MKRPKIHNNFKKEKNLVAPFMEDMEQYMAALDIIAKTNHIDLNTTNQNE
jgi:glutamine synthetase type III